MLSRSKKPVWPMLFVYGTLRRGSRHAMHRLLTEASSFVGAAAFQGRMYRVARYPGVVASSDPADRVVGEVYSLHDPPTLLAELDRYEDCNPLDPQALYVRERHHVLLDSGQSLTAWVYLYNRSTAHLPRLESGDFMREEQA